MDAHDLMASPQRALPPTITIICEARPVPGQPGQAILEPRLSFTAVPGGWTSVHQLLAQVQHLVALEMVKEAGGRGQIAVVPEMPGELVRH